MRTKLVVKYWVFLLIAAGLNACGTNNFIRKHEQPLFLESAYGYGYLPELNHYSNTQLASRCASYERTTALDLALTLHCVVALLGREDLTESQQNLGFKEYNQLTEQLFQLRNASNNLVKVNYVGPDELTLVSQIEAIDSRLSPTVFGQLGSAAVSRTNNATPQGQNIDANYPLEGIYSPYSLFVDTIELSGLRVHITLKAVELDSPTQIAIKNNSYALRHSMAAAYLLLLQNADIHNFSWLGFTNAEVAENRMGIFSIGTLSFEKTPIVMIHGLNSDPLIWRHLTMAIFNNEALAQQFQVWHVYYPSGPPPFYNAMRVRHLLSELKERVKRPGNTASNAIIVGHSMGGVIAKLVASNSGNALWNATFTAEPEALLSDDDSLLRDVFIFQPVYENNTVFFLDTPHRGSDVANSFIGMLGSSLITLPLNFKTLFKNFIDKVGVNKLTIAMLPFLQNYGPDSVQVLRPNHPLMSALAEIPVAGNSFSIIGSTNALSCDSPLSCSTISDSVVSYDSAFMQDAQDTIIVNSAHNSFKSPEAISFILNKLKQKRVSAKTVQNSLDM